MVVEDPPPTGYPDGVVLINAFEVPEERDERVVVRSSRFFLQYVTRQSLAEGSAIPVQEWAEVELPCDCLGE